ncbi:hypothetical protein [Nonomuraea recticatena]|uniref:hypothetical protein n=1 Tax=Nonomuraea recticatena TaxID=46178 RepID=UPI003608E795
MVDFDDLAVKIAALLDGVCQGAAARIAQALRDQEMSASMPMISAHDRRQRSDPLP